MANYYSTTKADATVSIQDFIALRNSDEITYYNYSILEYLNGYDMFISNLLYDYEDEINDLAVTIKLTNIERAKYRYKPYLLAYDIYGSTETKFILMMLNNIIDPKEFDFETIRALSPDFISFVYFEVSFKPRFHLAHEIIVNSVDSVKESSKISRP